MPVPTFDRQAPKHTLLTRGRDEKLVVVHHRLARSIAAIFAQNSSLHPTHVLTPMGPTTRKKMRELGDKMFRFLGIARKINTGRTHSADE